MDIALVVYHCQRLQNAAAYIFEPCAIQLLPDRSLQEGRLEVAEDNRCGRRRIYYLIQQRSDMLRPRRKDIKHITLVVDPGMITHTLDYDIFEQLFLQVRSLVRVLKDGCLVVIKQGEWLVPGKPDGFLQLLYDTIFANLPSEHLLHMEESAHVAMDGKSDDKQCFESKVLGSVHLDLYAARASYFPILKTVPQHT